MNIDYIDLINDVYYAIETLREDPSLSDVRPGCDCGCGGDSFDFDSYDEEYRKAIKTLRKYGIEVTE